MDGKKRKQQYLYNIDNIYKNVSNKWRHEWYVGVADGRLGVEHRHDSRRRTHSLLELRREHKRVLHLTRSYLQRLCRSVQKMLNLVVCNCKSKYNPHEKTEQWRWIPQRSPHHKNIICVVHSISHHRFKKDACLCHSYLIILCPVTHYWFNFSPLPMMPMLYTSLSQPWCFQNNTYTKILAYLTPWETMRWPP